MNTNKNISLKNYIILSFILIISIIIVIYFYMWYDEIRINNFNTPIIDEYLSIVNYNEFDTFLIENKDVVIYVSYYNNDITKSFEKKFGKIINQHSLNNKILYLNLSNEYNDDKLFNVIKSKYKLLNSPCIVIFKDGKVNDVYSISDYNYDIKLLVGYLRIKGVIYD